MVRPVQKMDVRAYGGCPSHAPLGPTVGIDSPPWRCSKEGEGGGPREPPLDGYRVRRDFGIFPGMAPAVPQKRVSKLMGNHVMGKGARASVEGALKGHQSASPGSLRTRDEELCSSRPSRVGGRNREPWVLHELVLHVFRQCGEDMQDTFLQRLIGDKRSNKIVNRFRMISCDPQLRRGAVRPTGPLGRGDGRSLLFLVISRSSPAGRGPL